MNKPSFVGMTTAELLAQSVRVWFSRAGLFVMILGIPMAALLVMEVFAVYAIFPPMEGSDLRSVWRGLSGLKRFFFGVSLLTMCAAYFRALAASVFAAQEIRSGRSVGFLGAVRSVRRPQLRLFWIVLFMCLLPGPLGLLVLPILSYFVAPGLPVAVLESRTAAAALKRGEALSKGRRGRVALLVGLWLGLSVMGFVGMVFLDDIVKSRWGFVYVKPVNFLVLWIVSIVPQLCMVALALNYLDARRREETVAENG